MALNQRLAEMERRIAALEALAKDLAQAQADMAQAIEEEDKPQPTLNLDGEEEGEERDQDTPL